MKEKPVLQILHTVEIRLEFGKLCKRDVEGSQVNLPNDTH